MKSLNNIFLMGLVALVFGALPGSAQEKETSVPFKGVKITKGAMYRANPGRTGVFKATGVTQKPSVAWTAEIGGEITSSPVAFEGKVYVGGQDGFYALDAQTGKVAWKFEVKGGVESSACIANDVLCFADTGATLIALNAKTGTEMWRYASKTKTAEKTRSSPAMAYGVVFCALAREIVALDMMTGRVIWSLTGDKASYPASFGSVALTPKTLFLFGGSNWDCMYGHDLATSEIVFKTGQPWDGGQGVYLRNTPAITENGDIFINETRKIRRFSKEKNDRERKDLKYPLWVTFLLDKEVDDNELIEQSCATPWKDRVFGGRFDGKFAAVAMQDGKQLWIKRYPAEILSAPSVADSSGLVFFGCFDGHLYALDANTGDERWKFKTGGKIISSPWVGDGVIYVSSTDGKVYALR